MLGELLIRWTIWASMLAYAGFLFIVLCPDQLAWPFRRAVWTFSWIMFAGHFLAAFHFYHGWSHSHAVADTARKTNELLGWSFGEGIYLSYLFLAIWGGDVAWSWLAAASYQSRYAAIGWIIHGYVFFIAINGTAVFEAGVTRIGTVICCVGLLVGIVMRARKK